MLKNTLGSVVCVVIAGVIFANLLDRNSALSASSPEAQGRHQREQPSQARYVNTAGYSDIVRLPKAPNGHFYTELMVNRRPVDVLVDTGATVLALRDSDALAAGLRPRHTDFIHNVSTANGTAKAARMTAREIELGPLVVRNAEVLILPDESLAISLLGMNVLSGLGDVRFDTRELVIERKR